jgi:short-subunit dehydrogenase
VTTVALITGATEGIGLELAKCFARARHDLVLVARDREKLERVASEISAGCGVRVSAIAQDLSAREGARRVFDEVRSRAISVDFLVNNAGVGTFGLFAEADLDKELGMMQLNMATVTELTGLFLPRMLQRRSGRILNVASTAAFQPGPLMAVYYATKAYVVSFTEALANELRGTGVVASVLCPGPTRSEFQRRAGMGASKLFRSGVMDPSVVAETAYRGLMKGKTTIVPGLRNKMLMFAVRLGPRKLLPYIVRRMQEPV